MKDESNYAGMHVSALDFTTVDLCRRMRPKGDETQERPNLNVHRSHRLFERPVDGGIPKVQVF